MGERTESPGQINSLPRGGGALSGLGEKFEPDVFTGTGNFSVPIEIPSGRGGHEPELSLTYSTGYGPGPFGLGWSLSLPEVTRRTAAGVPRYDDNQDVFMLAGSDDLVPVAQELDSGRTRYRPRTEIGFDRIEHCRTDKNDYWQVTDRGGNVDTFGTPLQAGADDATVADPQARTRVFAWKLTSSADPFGNLIRYEYAPHGADLTGDGRSDQAYLTAIRYIDYGDRTEPRFLVGVEFIYEPQPYLRSPAGPRAEVSSYNAGFEIRTALRCTRIEVCTYPGARVPVRTYHLRYAQSAAGLSLLFELQVEGRDGDKSEWLPPMRFSYGAFAPEQRRFLPISGADRPSEGLEAPGCDLADLFGRGLPDIIQWDGQLRYWRNLGDGRLDLPREISAVPAGLSLTDPDAVLLDANGDGRVDLLVNTPAGCGYYPMGPDGAWDRGSFRPLKAAPSFALKDPLVRLVDLDGDGVTDAIRSGETGFECCFLHPIEGWKAGGVQPYRALEQCPAIRFDDPRVQFADMNGDGLQDLVLVDSGQLAYWPSLGYGRFAARAVMSNSPHLPYGFDPARILLGDVDGDGAADLIYVADGKVTLWLNKCGRAWSDPVVITGTPTVSHAQGVRVADMLGQGTGGLLWSEGVTADRRDSLFFCDLTGGKKPYLLTQIDNGMGAVTQVTYASSTRFYLQDQTNPATRWRTALPFPVQVVATVQSLDQITGSAQTTRYHYHHGYWDGAEREFRGFARVDAFDASVPDGPEAPTPVETRRWFHLGQLDAAAFAHEYWPGDPTYVGGVAALPQLDPRGLREAARGLRGHELRTEVFIHDGAERATRPQTVTESGYSVAVLAAPGAGLPGIFSPRLDAVRETEWERGDDPQTQITYVDEYDAYGQPGKELEIAVPRGRNFREAAAPGAPYLALLTRTLYARPADDSAVVDCEATITEWEVVNDGALSAQSFHVEALNDRLPRRLVSETQHHFDGEAFIGLPCGEVGRYGALTRTESRAFERDELEQAYGRVPPYLEPDGAPLTDEYPAEFRTALPPLAGYRYHDGAWWTPDEQNAYDFQRAGSPGRGLKVETRSASGSITTVAYDPYDLLPLRLVDPAGNVAQVGYDYRVLEPALYTDPNGNRTLLTYTPLGLPASSAAMGKEGEPVGDTPAVPSVRWVYDWQIPVSVRTIQREHAVTEPDLPPDERDRTLERIEYSDGFGRLVQVRSSGARIRFGDPVYGDGLMPDIPEMPHGPCTGVRWQEGAPPWVEVSGHVVYDSKGRVIRSYAPYWSAGWAYAAPTGPQLGPCESMRYDPLGRLTCTKHPDGSEARSVYGVPTNLADPDQYAPTPWETYSYDGNDNAGRTHRERAQPYMDHWNTPTSIVEDGLGRAVERVDWLAPGICQRTSQVYSLKGDVLEIYDQLQRRVESTRYDCRQMPLRSERLDAGLLLSVPDADGEIIEERDAKGALTLRAFDRLERITSVWARDGQGQPVTLREHFIYGDSPESRLPREQAVERNLLGRLYSRQDEAGILIHEQYDYLGNAVEKVRLVADRVYRVSHRFDAVGRITGVQYPADVTGRRHLLAPTYDHSGALERLALDGQAMVERIAYNARGQQTLVACGNGIMTRRLHHSASAELLRRRSEAYVLAAGPAYVPWEMPLLEDTAFDYDLVGNPLVMLHMAPGSGLPEQPDWLKRGFRYDPIYRLVFATGRECPVPGAQPWDAAPRPGDVASAHPYTEFYQYDPVSNLLRIDHYIDRELARRTYDLRPGLNQLQALVEKGVSIPYAYDPCGNLTCEAGVRHFTVDHLNRISEFKHQDGTTEPTVTVRHRYDAAGSRVLRQVRRPGGEIETTVYIDGAFEHHRLERDGALVTENSVLHVRNGADHIAMVRIGTAFPGDPAPATQYLLSDHLGSSLAVLGGEGNLVNREEYFPYGGTSFGGLAGKRFRFHGKERDAESGLSYFGGRYYAAHLGRWTSCDPIGYADGLSLYTYVDGNPLAYADLAGFGRTKATDKTKAHKATGMVNSAKATKQQKWPRPAWRKGPKAMVKDFVEQQQKLDKKERVENPNLRHIIDNLTLERFAHTAANAGFVSVQTGKKDYSHMYNQTGNLYVGDARHNQGMGSTTPRVRNLKVKLSKIKNLTTVRIEQDFLKTVDKRIRSHVEEFTPVLHSGSPEEALDWVENMGRGMTLDLPTDSFPQKVRQLLEINERMSDFIKDPTKFTAQDYQDIKTQFLNVK